MELTLLSNYKDYASFYTGLISMDFYLQGLPRGHFLEFAGRESSYKTTLIQNAFGAVQQEYKDSVKYLYIDTEGNVSKEYFENCGGIAELTDFYQANVSEDILDLVFKYIVENNKNSIPSLVAIDSIAGFTTEHEVEKGITKATMGDFPRILNRFLRLTAIPLKEFGSTVVFNNQLRADLNSQFGGTTTPGGRGLNHWCKYIIKLYDQSSKSKLFKLNTEEEGHPVSFQVEKSKNQLVYKGFTFDIDVIFGKGFSKELDIINFGVNNMFIEKRGHFYTLPNGEKFNSKNTLYDYLLANPDVSVEMYKELRG